MTIPNLLLKRLYTVGSLKNAGGSAEFAIKNRLSDAELVGLRSIAIDGHAVALEHVRLDLQDGRMVPASQVSAAHPLPFPLSATVTIRTGSPELPRTRHAI